MIQKLIQVVIKPINFHIYFIKLPKIPKNVNLSSAPINLTRFVLKRGRHFHLNQYKTTQKRSVEFNVTFFKYTSADCELRLLQI